MKTIILGLGLMVGSTSSLKLEGIDKDALMQNNPSHWRKPWPEGDTDDGNGDAEVMEMFLKKKAAKPKAKITYPWNYDDDVIETGKSLETAEGLTGAKLSHDAVKDGGLGMIFTYDNTKVQNRRGYVHGPHEWAKMQAADADYKL
jgi:uncharacterized protein YjdB